MKSKIHKSRNLQITVICKKLIFVIAASFLLFACGSKEDLAVKTEKLGDANLRSTFKVWGNCEMCKDAIENSLQGEGITEASWNMETKALVVTYDSTKITLDQVQKNVAAVGYDNVKYKGDDKAYENLPGCCKYDRK